MKKQNIITVAEAAAILKTGPRAVLDLIRKGTIPARKTSAGFLVLESALNRPAVINRPGRGRPRKVAKK